MGVLTATRARLDNPAEKYWVVQDPRDASARSGVTSIIFKREGARNWEVLHMLILLINATTTPLQNASVPEAVAWRVEGVDALLGDFGDEDNTWSGGEWPKKYDPTTDFLEVYPRQGRLDAQRMDTPQPLFNVNVSAANSGGQDMHSASIAFSINTSARGTWSAETTRIAVNLVIYSDPSPNESSWGIRHCSRELGIPQNQTTRQYGHDFSFEFTACDFEGFPAPNWPGIREFEKDWTCNITPDDQGVLPRVVRPGFQSFPMSLDIWLMSGATYRTHASRDLNLQPGSYLATLYYKTRLAAGGVPMRVFIECPEGLVPLHEGGCGCEGNAERIDEDTCKDCMKYEELRDGKCSMAVWLMAIMVIMPLFVALLGLLGCLLARKAWLRKKAKLLSSVNCEKEKRTKIDAAIATLQRLDFPMCVVSADDFMELGKLLPHETLRDRGKLRYFDSVDAAMAFASSHPIVFFSHQWLGWHEPDPRQVQYELATVAVRQLRLECGGSGGDELYLWFDYFSIPQRNRSTQDSAIASLSNYAAACRYFVAVVPCSVHEDTGEICDESTYLERGWCRLEQWSHMSKYDLEGFYKIASVERGLQSIEDEPAWYKEALYVFEGKFTVESDKERLVSVVLSLYALTLMRSEGVKNWGAATAAADAMLKIDSARNTETQSVDGHAHHRRQSASSTASAPHARGAPPRTARDAFKQVFSLREAVAEDAMRLRIFPTDRFSNMADMLEETIGEVVQQEQVAPRTSRATAGSASDSGEHGDGGGEDRDVKNQPTEMINHDEGIRPGSNDKGPDNQTSVG